MSIKNTYNNEVRKLKKDPENSVIPTIFVGLVLFGMIGGFYNAASSPNTLGEIASGVNSNITIDQNYDTLCNEKGVLCRESISTIVQTCQLEEFNFSREQCSYALATADYETASYNHMEEINGSQNAINFGYSGGSNYYGRGYVMLTHDTNYTLWSGWLGVDLHQNPNLLIEDKVLSARVLVSGLKFGSFTGSANGVLSDYVSDSGVDFYLARQLVNGFDKAQIIAERTDFYNENINYKTQIT